MRFGNGFFLKINGHELQNISPIYFSTWTTPSGILTETRNSPFTACLTLGGIPLQSIWMISSRSMSLSILNIGNLYREEKIDKLGLRRGRFLDAFRPFGIQFSTDQVDESGYCLYCWATQGQSPIRWRYGGITLPFRKKIQNAHHH